MATDYLQLLCLRFSVRTSGSCSNAIHIGTVRTIIVAMKEFACVRNCALIYQFILRECEIIKREELVDHFVYDLLLNSLYIVHTVYILCNI